MMNWSLEVLTDFGLQRKDKKNILLYPLKMCEKTGFDTRPKNRADKIHEKMRPELSAPELKVLLASTHEIHSRNFLTHKGTHNMECTR